MSFQPGLRGQVPRSSTKLAEDNEYALYTVVLFKKVADTFKTHAREKGFQVRKTPHLAGLHELNRLISEDFAH